MNVLPPEGTPEDEWPRCELNYDPNGWKKDLPPPAPMKLSKILALTTNPNVTPEMVLEEAQERGLEVENDLPSDWQPQTLQPGALPAFTLPFSGETLPSMTVSPPPTLAILLREGRPAFRSRATGEIVIEAGTEHAGFVRAIWLAFISSGPMAKPLPEHLADLEPVP